MESIQEDMCQCFYIQEVIVDCCVEMIGQFFYNRVENWIGTDLEKEQNVIQS